MAKLIQQFPTTGDVMTHIGIISFVNGEAEVPDDVAAELEGIADIRVVLGGAAKAVENVEKEASKDVEAKDEAPAEAPAKKVVPPRAPVKK